MIQGELFEMTIYFIMRSYFVIDILATSQTTVAVDHWVLD